MTISTQTKQLLQELYILATGQPSNTSEMAMIEALVGADGNLRQINNLIDNYINQHVQDIGAAGMIKLLAKNGMGVTLSDAEANAALSDFAAAGLTTWSSLFQWAAADEGTYGDILSNRGEAASYFTNALASANKTDFFAGTSVNTAVSNLLKTISGTLASLTTAQHGLDELATRLTKDGLVSAVVDGYVAGATIFADADGDGKLDDGEWTTTTDASGNYVLPTDLPAGKLIASGGTDLLTGLAFKGVLTAPAGSTVVTPLTTMIQALLDNDPNTDLSAAISDVRSALNLPAGVDLQTYDPIAVLDNSSATAAAKATALAVQKVSLQVANILTQTANALFAADGTTSLQSATAAVANSLAQTLKGGTTVDLSSQTTLSTVLTSAATASSSPLTTTQINQITTVTAASNAGAAAATTVNALANVAFVSQGSATSSIITGTTNNTLDSTVTSFTGANLTSAVDAATPADVPGGTTEPSQTPTPTFTVTETAGVVTFSGTATGNISVAFTGDVATFTREGIDASTKPDFSGTAASVEVASGQTLTGTIANLAVLDTFTGAGNVNVTAATTVANLALLDVSGLTGTFTYNVADIAANLDNAADSAFESLTANVTVTDSATIAQLNSIDALWGTVTATSITDSQANLAAATGSAFIGAAINVNVTDAASIAQLNALDAVWGTVTPSAVIDIAANLDGAGDSVFENSTVNVTVTDESTLAQLALIDDLWGTVTYSDITDTTALLVTNAEGYVSGSVNVTATTDATIAQLTTIDGFTTGTVTATQITDIASTIAASSYVSSGTTVTLTAGTVSADHLSTIDDNSDETIDASAVTGINGGPIDIIAAYTGDISGLGNENLIVIGESSAADVETILTATTGTVTVGLANAYTTGASFTVAAGDAIIIDPSGTVAPLNASAEALVSDVDAAGEWHLNAANGLFTWWDSVSNSADSMTLTGINSVEVLADKVTIPSLNLGITDNGGGIWNLTGGSGDITVTLNALNLEFVADTTTITALAADVSTIVIPSGRSLVGAAALLSEFTTLSGDVVLSDNGSLDAASLNTIDTATTGSVDASLVTTLTGTASAVASALASGGITGLGDEAVTLSDTTLAAADLNAIDTATSGAIDASSVTTVTGTASVIATAYASGGITNLGDEAITLSDTTLTAADLNALDGLTSGAVNASSVTTLTGTVSAIATAYASAGITNLGDEAITLSDTTLTAADLNAIDGLTAGAVNASSVTTVTGAASAIATAYASAGITNLGDEAITLSDTTLAAADLNAIDTATSGAIDASSVTTVTGTASAIATAYASAGISNLGDEAVTLSDTTLAAADLNAIDTATSGTIDASSVTTVTGTASAIATAYASAGITNLGDPAVTLSDTTLAAADLNALDGLTSGVVNASSVTTVTGTASDIATAYASAGISNLGDEDITLSDTTLAAADLNALDGLSTGAVNASSVTTVTGTASAIATAYASAGISNLGDEDIDLSDTTLAAADLNALDDLTSGIIQAGSVTTLTGTASAVATAYASDGIFDLDDAAVTLSDTTLAAADLNAIDTATSGAIDAGSVTTMTGTASAIATAYASAGITNLGDAAVTLSDTTLAAADLNALDGLTSGAVNASSVTTLTGTAAEITAAYAANTAGTITGLGNEIVTVSDSGSVAATALTDLDALSTGAVGFASVTTLTGSAAEITAAYAANTAGTITGLGNEIATVSDSGSIAATALTDLDALTTGAVGFASVTTLTGTAAEITAAYSANTAGTITGLGDEIVTASDAGSVTATAVTDLDALTTGAVSFASVTTLTGTAAEITAAYAANTAGTVTGLGDEIATVSDSGSVAATVLTDLDALTTGAAGFASVTTLTGTAAEITAAYAANTAGTITGLGDEIVAASDAGSVAATLLTDLDALTTGAVGFASVTTLTGTATEITAAYAANTAGTVTGLGDEIVTASDAGSVAATALTDLDALTTGAVSFASVTTLTGTVAEIAAAYAANTATTINGLGNEAVTLSGAASATDITAIATATSGTIDGSALTEINGTAAEVLQALTEMDTDPTDFNTTLTGSITTTDLTAIQAAVGTGTIDSSGITTLQVTSTSDISGLNSGAAIAATLDATTVAAINITMTVAQHNGFSTAINANGGDDTITLTDAGTFTTDADIGNYSIVEGSIVSVGDSAGQLAQVITETGAEGTVSTFVLTSTTIPSVYTGDWSGIDSDDVIQFNNAGNDVYNISGNSGLDSGVTLDFGNDNAQLVLSPTQWQNATVLNTILYQALTFSAAGTFSTDAGIEKFNLAAGTNEIATTANGQDVGATSLVDGQVLTLTGSHNVSVSLVGGDLTSTSSGNITVNAYGQSNIITTGPGDDVIAAGPGPDTLDGGTGANVYKYNATSDGGTAAGAGDTIAAFVTTSDKLQFKNTAFGTMGAGDLAVDSNTVAFNTDESTTLADFTLAAGTDGNVYVIDLTGSTFNATLYDAIDVAAAAGTAAAGAAFYVVSNGSDTVVLYDSAADTSGAGTLVELVTLIGVTDAISGLANGDLVIGS